jgi:hypothetical protein
LLTFYSSNPGPYGHEYVQMDISKNGPNDFEGRLKVDVPFERF